jgi:hypothetical protein
LQAAEKRSFEAADAEGRGEVLVGLAYDQVSKPIFDPPGFNRCEPEQDDRENKCDQAGDDLRERC